jgi:hypothetical protein
MTFQRRPRILIGLILIAVGVGIGVYRTTTTTRIVAAPPPQRDTPANDSGVTFGTEVEEKLVRVDLRIPALFGIIGIGLIASTFIHRNT